MREYSLTPTRRLNLQHYLWKETLGYDLHPSAKADDASEPLHIADVGTGTGFVKLLVISVLLSPSNFEYLWCL
jgi:hypothetical protein